MVEGSSRIKDIIKKTINSIEKQGVLPKSPCKEYGGGYIYCAGAWLVYHAVKILKGERDAAVFLAELESERRTNAILEWGRKANIRYDFVKGLIAANDNSKESERVKVTVDHLVSVLSEGA